VADVDPDKFKPVKPEEDGSSKGWIIALCVILGILLLAGAGFFLWKKK